MKRFTLKEQRILNEIERRLRYFKTTNINTKLLLLELPSEVKTLIKKGYLTPSNGKEVKYNFKWYMLTEKGKIFFSKIKLNKLSEELNLEMYQGKLIRNYNGLEV